MSRDPVATLIAEINGSCKPTMIAAINGNLPDGWQVYKLDAMPTFREPPIAVFADAVLSGHSRVTGGKVEVKCDLGKEAIASALAEDISANIAKRASERSVVQFTMTSRSAPPERPYFKLLANATQQIQPGRVQVVPTGVQIEVPRGLEAQVRPWHALTVRGVWSQFRTVDAGYRCSLDVALVNLSTEAQTIMTGDVVAHLAFTAPVQPEVEVVH